MSKALDFSPDLKLPDDAVTQTFAFLARKGAGKTYGAGKLVEELIGNGDQVVVVDPVGTWYGLRLAANGKSPGIPITILGGLHGDIPLEPSAGALIAKLVVEKNVSVVLDVSQFRKGDRKRFVTDFAEELFHRKKAQRSPMHLVVEEAQVFVPQRTMGDEARMLGAFEDLVKLGRNFGIGVTLISQRPQSVNKDALNQSECLVVLQTNGAQERKAVEAWIVEQGVDIGDLVDSLPSLERGEAWVWSPSWLRKTERIHIGKKWTFDASATPERGAKAAQVEPLDPLALDELAQAMQATIERAKADDPKALRQQLLEARNEIERLKKVAPAPAPAKERRVEVPVLKDGQIKRLEAFLGRLASTSMMLSEHLLEMRRTLDAAVAHQRPGTVAPARTPPSYPPRKTEYKPVPMPPARRPGPVESNGELSEYAQGLLRTLAERHPMQLTPGQLAALSGRSSRSSAFDSSLAKLRKAGLVESRGRHVVLTDSGRALVGAVSSAPTSPEEQQQAWLRVLPDYERDLLKALLDAGHALSREQLGELAGKSTRSSAFDGALASLRRNGLVEIAAGEIQPTEELRA